MITSNRIKERSNQMFNPFFMLICLLNLMIKTVFSQIDFEPVFTNIIDQITEL